MNSRARSNSSRAITPDPDIRSLIFEIRGQKVILDAGLASIYGVPTKALNQAVKRNRRRFPAEFVFELTAAEVHELNRSQIVTGSRPSRFSDPHYDSGSTSG